MEDGGSNVIAIYHGNCNDGFCSAWVIRKAFPNAQLYPATHGNPPPDVAGKDVYIADFAYKRPVLLEMKAKAKSLVVLDHHKSAAEDLHGLDFCIFDMSKSGAHITWDYLFNGKEPPWLVQYTEDRDLSMWELPHSREVNAALSGYPFDFQTWDNLDRMVGAHDLYSSHCEFVQDGAAICRFQNLQIENIIKNAREMKLDNYKILAANTSVGFSDVAGKLARNYLFGVAWYLREDGKYVYSLRSKEFDVSKLAAEHGGGGHRSSAGFSSDKFVLVG